MGKFIDLTGRTFGRLTVIERVVDKQRGRPLWRCKCECGNEVEVTSTRLLRNNGTRSCGCLRSQESPGLIDLTGMTFGKLTVIERDKTVPRKPTKWICACECGNTVSVLSTSLRSGSTTSCGCSQFTLQYDLTGQTVGFLEVVEPTKNEMLSGNEIRWKCLCKNCGRTVEVESYWLRNGNPYGHCNCSWFGRAKISLQT